MKSNEFPYEMEPKRTLDCQMSEENAQSYQHNNSIQCFRAWNKHNAIEFPKQSRELLVQ